MIRLMEDPTRQSAGDSVMWVSWCLPTDIREAVQQHLEEHSELQPFLLLTVGQMFYGGRDGERNGELYEMNGGRQIVELSQARACINFQRPDTNLIAATIVFAESIKKAKHRYLEKTRHGRYENEILTRFNLNLDAVSDPFQEAAFKDEYSDFQQRISYCLLEVKVNPELFAKKPRDWEWITDMLRGEPKNQCEIRRYRMFAYTLQPIAMIALTVFCLVVSCIIGLVFFGYGNRKVRWSALKPFSAGWDPDVAMNDTTKMNSVFITDRHGNVRAWCFPMFSPITIAIVWMATFLIMDNLTNPATIYEYSLVALRGWALITITLSVLWLIQVAILLALNGWEALLKSDTRTSYLVRRDERLNTIRLELEKRRLAALDCAVLAESGAPSASGLSLRSRVYIGYHGLKARLCKPIAE